MNGIGSIGTVIGIFAAVGLTGSLPGEQQVIGAHPAGSRVASASDSSLVFSQMLGGINPWGIACHPDTGRIYFSDPTGGAIGWFDPGDAEPVATELILRPGAVFHGIEIDAGNNRLLFLDSSNDSVNAVDLTTSVETQIVAGAWITRPNDLAYDAARDRILFTDSGADSIGVIRANEPGFQRIDLPETAGAWGIVVHPVTGTVYFSSHDLGKIFSIDPDAAPVAVTEIATGLKGPRGLELDSFGRLFCLESGEGRVIEISLPGETVASPAFTGIANGRGFEVFDTDFKDIDLLRDGDGDGISDAWELRYREVVGELDGSSDPERDGLSLFEEFLFNGSPELSGEISPPRLTEVDGEIVVEFESLTAGVPVEVWLSSDLVNWQRSPSPRERVHLLEDRLYSLWRSTVSAGVLGLDGSRVFGKLTPAEAE